MKTLQKVCSLMVILTLATSIIGAFEPANALSKPTTPEFTMKYVDRSYNVSANYTYEINPYNGEQVETGHGAYRVNNETIEITIKNQQMASYKDPDNKWNYQLCYNISWKGHYEDTWHYWGYYRDSMSPYYPDVVYYLHQAYANEYTTFVFGFGTQRESTLLMPNLGDFPDNTQLDFRVQALFGYYREGVTSMVPGFRPSYDFFFTGVTSDWSDTQTVTLHESISTSPPTQTTTTMPSTSTGLESNPQQGIVIQLSYEQVALIVMAVIIAGLVAALVLTRRKQQ